MLPEATLQTRTNAIRLTYRIVQPQSAITSAALENTAAAVEPGLAVAQPPEPLINRAGMRVLDEAMLPPPKPFSMHMIISNQAGQQTQQEVRRCMTPLVDLLRP